MNAYLRGLARGATQGAAIGTGLGLLLYFPVLWLTGSGVPTWAVGFAMLVGIVSAHTWRDRRRRLRREDSR